MADSPASAPRFLAPAQVAELLAIEVDEVIALVVSGRLHGAQLGTPARWRIAEDSISDYLAEQTEEARRIALWRQADAASFPKSGNPAPDAVAPRTPLIAVARRSGKNS